MPDTTAPIPVESDSNDARALARFLEALHKWGPWVAGFVLFVMTTTAAAVLIYAATKNDVANMRLELASAKSESARIASKMEELDKAGSEALRVRASKIERDVAELQRAREGDETMRKELLRRVGNMERFLARIVCKQEPGPPCEQAMALIGQ